MGWARYRELHDPVWLQANASRQSISIARELGCSPSLIAWAYRTAGIERNVTRSQPHTVIYPQLHDSAFLEGKTFRQVAELTGAASTTIYEAFAEARVRPVPPPRPPVPPRPPKGPAPPRYPQLADHVWLTANRHRTLVELALELGASVEGVTKAFRRHGITRTRDKRRTASTG